MKAGSSGTYWVVDVEAASSVAGEEVDGDISAVQVLMRGVCLGRELLELWSSQFK
jgi:hypothetical protein